MKRFSSNEAIILAWRNLWRNKRRTLITVSSVFFGVILCTFMASMQYGSYELMVRTTVNAYSGYIQIHQQGYWDEKIINNAMSLDSQLISKLKKDKRICAIAPRIESFSLASSDNLTKGVMVMGIEPENENKVTKIKAKMVKGKYLTTGDNGVVLGQELARFMRLEVGDTLVLIGQGYQGISAAGKYPVKGIVKHPSPDFNKMIVYLDMAAAQELFSAYNLATAVVIMLADQNQLLAVQKDIKSKTDKSLEVMNWLELQPLLVQQIAFDKVSNMISKLILYMVIAFGILGTVMMMIAERKRELGVMIAVGMQRARLAMILLFETCWMGMIGVLAGFAGAIPIVWYFHLNPIRLTGQAAETLIEMGYEPLMLFSVEPYVFIEQATIVLLFCLLIGIYPFLTVRKLNVMNAIRGK